ncbi:hypothetical protein M1L60_10110 [Actinoplanes sp. TRM 88003]|uniref:Lipoprotein n=1 Tax=Paractinoplanes aksuensis TaxID=2939490 RepID=A0ABT1DJD1_9ACTN|nr:hypothetical protein [Actinoplanes aksuensis]MCO8270946.1 hypothetical protein [Actinoplanes aksuensis]
MGGSPRRVGALAALALVGGCGGNDDAVGDKKWTLAADQCPAWTAPALAGLKPLNDPQKADLPNVLTFTCAYGSTEKPPAAIGNVELVKSDQRLTPPEEEANSQLEAARRAGDPHLELSGLAGRAIAYTSNEGGLEAYLWTGNAKLQAMVLLEAPVTTQGQMDDHEELLVSSLRDLLGTLKSN